MSIIDDINGIIRNDPKDFGRASYYDFTTKTGFECLDYLNGQIVPLDDGSKQLYTGLSNGRVCMIIGKSGTGKSTLAIQLGANIIRRYDNGLMYLMDFEQNNSKERIRGVTGMSEEYYNKHVTILRDGISTESVIRLLSKIKELKVAHEDEISVPNENGIKGTKTGEIIKILPPTVVIVDSLALMMPADNLSEEDIQGSMSATGIAKTNSQFFKKAVQICSRGNIMLFIINHITQQISISATPVAAQLNYLKQDEAISGGKAALYVTDTLIKITAGSKLEADKLWGIKGFEAKVEICKSRHAPAGRSVTLIYDQTNGFSNPLSILQYIKDCGALSGNGMAYYIEGYDAVKFRLSNFKEKYETDNVFRDHVIAKADELLKGSIKESGNILLAKQEHDADEALKEKDNDKQQQESSSTKSK